MSVYYTYCYAQLTAYCGASYELTGCAPTARQVARALIQYQQTLLMSVHDTYCCMQLTACSVDHISYRPLATLHSLTEHQVLTKILKGAKSTHTDTFTTSHRVSSQNHSMIDTRPDTTLPLNRWHDQQNIELFGNVWQAEKQATQAATSIVADLKERKSKIQFDENTAWSQGFSPQSC